MQGASHEREFERRAIVAALGWLCDPLRTMDNLQSGDVVQLKSGGPAMTIHSVNRDGSIFCHWFNEKGELMQGTFQPGQLKKASGE